VEAIPFFIEQGGKESMTTTATAVNTVVSASPSASKSVKPFNYAPFRQTVRKFINGKITREGFYCEWGIEQKEQGIWAARRKV
jgi:hypothetical protein